MTKKAAAAKALPMLKKFGKKTYKKVACTKLKSAANKKAKAIRKTGKKARVVKNPAGGSCVFVSGTAKVAGKKKTTTTTKRRVTKRRKA